MTREEKIAVLAELDGYSCPIHGCGIKNGESVLLPPYLTSYDAIIPLIQKLQHPSVGWFDLQRSTPEQLADALIKAVGKWKD